MPLAPAPTLKEIFTAEGPFVWRTLRYLGIAERDLEDVSQEVFLVVHRKLAGFQGRSAVRTWLYGICVRVASDHRNRAHVRREIPVETPPEEGAPPSQIEGIERTQARAMLASVLHGLDEDKRAVFVLYEIEELGMNEVAEALGCPLQTAYSRLHAARRLVAEALERMKERVP